MKRLPPLISVIIPTFNRAAFLPSALASVQAQAIAPLQVIVVDDGSTDETAMVMRGLDPTFEYVYQPNQGAAAARNTGVRHARGEWIAFLDSDDLWVAGRLHRQLALAAAYPTARVIWGMLQITRQSEADLALFEPDGRPVLQTSFETALIQRSLFATTQIGLLDESLFTGEDADWFCRLFMQNIEIVVHKEVVAFYRWHQANLVANQPNGQAQAAHGLMQALAHSLRQRRQNAAGEQVGAMKPNIHWVAA